MVKITEAKIAQAVIAWLQADGWDVYQEVATGWNGNRADVVGVRGRVAAVVECKTDLSLRVLEQARHWPVQRRWIAVPAPTARGNGRVFAYQVARDVAQAGVLEVRSRPWSEERLDVEVRVQAPILREFNDRAADLIAKCRPEHKTTKAAGTAGGGYWTPYRSTIDQVRNMLRTAPEPLTMRQILAGCRHHYASDKSALGSLRSALLSFESTWAEAVQVDGQPVRFRLRKGASC